MVEGISNQRMVTKGVAQQLLDFKNLKNVKLLQEFRLTCRKMKRKRKRKRKKKEEEREKEDKKKE